jgi:endonuclease/exonuclease/phosphatase family metal-dependent hydrolase
MPGRPPFGVASLAFILLFAVGACRTGVPDPPTPRQPSNVTPLCRLIQLGDSPPGTLAPLSWKGAWQTDSDPWCQAVGPALARGVSTPPPPATLSDLAIVSWNVHVGGGDIDSLIEDLRRGQLDGQPSNAFVLLLQEVFRSGSEVPDDPGPGAKDGGRVAPGPDHGAARSIEAVARRNGLNLLYVPSMRNGGPGDPPEDRGNAILATFPLEDREALELPMERQRRVAIAARITVGSETNQPVELRLVNLHLDARSEWSQLYRSLGTGRADQSRVVAEQYGHEPVVVLGGDLNTWFGGPGEQAVRILSEVFPHPEPRLDLHTVGVPGPLPDLMLDHLFFRLPTGMVASYEVIQDQYGSDHYPVVGRISNGASGPDSGRRPGTEGDRSP